MTVFDALSKLTQGAALLSSVLEKAKAVPELSDEATQAQAALDAAVSSEGLAALATALPGEFMDIVKGNLNPKDHPSDAI